MNLLNEHHNRRIRVERQQRAMSEQMKQDGTHLLSGHPYTPSTQGSRILRQYLAATQMRLLTAIYRQGKP